MNLTLNKVNLTISRKNLSPRDNFYLINAGHGCIYSYRLNDKRDSSDGLPFISFVTLQHSNFATFQGPFEFSFIYLGHGNWHHVTYRLQRVETMIGSAVVAMTKVMKNRLI